MGNTAEENISRLKIKLALMVIFSLLGILVMGTSGCIHKLIKPGGNAGFNNFISSESFYSIIEDRINVGIPDQNMYVSKVALSLYKDNEPVDIENISLQIIKELNSQSMQINNELVKNNSKSNEQLQKNEVIPTSEEINPTSQAQDSNSLEIQIFDKINHIRVQNGMQKLNLNQVLTNIARLRSKDMINRNYFSHYTPEGKHATEILRENGVMYAGFGEILFRASSPAWGLPGTIINTWLSSNIHRNIILTPQFNQVGVGSIDEGNVRVVTVLFLN